VTSYRCNIEEETAIVPIGHEGDIIPIYEYACQSCGHRFEQLILGKAASAEVACPACAKTKVERVLSRPAVKSSGTHDLAMRAAKKRDARQGVERMRAQREYELNHDDH
jgi:putative FmdB family regulatory protein